MAVSLVGGLSKQRAQGRIIQAREWILRVSLENTSKCNFGTFVLPHEFSALMRIKWHVSLPEDDVPAILENWVLSLPRIPSAFHWQPYFYPCQETLQCANLTVSHRTQRLANLQISGSHGLTIFTGPTNWKAYIMLNDKGGWWNMSPRWILFDLMMEEMNYHGELSFCGGPLWKLTWDWSEFCLVTEISRLNRTTVNWDI